MPRNRRSAQRSTLDTGTFIFGSLLGLLAGSGLALWYAPKSGRALRRDITAGVTQTADAARAQVDALTADPVADSLAEGKAAARARRAELSRL